MPVKQPVNARELLPFNPAFMLASDPSLSVLAEGDAVSVHRFLCARISRSPLDLRAHVQRINLLRGTNDAGLLFAALVDLFLALGNKGRSLRETLLNWVKTGLREADISYLQKHLDRGLLPLDTIPISADSLSLLDRAIIGQTHLVERKRVERQSDADLVDCAIQYLEDGDVAAAQELLESAVIKDPQNAPANLELLEIYRRTRDEVAFQATKRKLLAMGIKLAAEWDKL